MSDAPSQNTPVNDLSDEELVLKVQAGDRASYEVIVIRHQKKILNVCYRLLGCSDGAKELAADIFAEAYLSIQSFRAKSKFGTWLYRIALNTGYTKLRKVTKDRKRFVAARGGDESHVGVLASASSKDPDPQEVAALAEDLEQIRVVLARIPRDHAKILMLHVVDGFSYVEISEMLECAPGTVMSRISRARESFKKLWNKTYGGGD